jgi:hypothetical protein
MSPTAAPGAQAHIAKTSRDSTLTPHPTPQPLHRTPYKHPNPCGLGAQAHIAKTGADHLVSWLHPGAFVASLVVTGAVNFFTVSAVFDQTDKGADEK